MATFGNSGINRIIPECKNIANSISISAIIEVVVALIAMIIAIVALVYLYQKGTTKDSSGTRTDIDMPADNVKQLKMIVYIQLGISVAVLLGSAWYVLLGMNLKKCITA